MTYEDLKTKVTSLDDIYNLLDNQRENKKLWRHRASSTSVFFANSLHYALQQGLGLHFGGNDKTLFGTIVHEAVDYAFVNPTHRRGNAIKVLINKALDEYQKIPEKNKNFNFEKLIKKAIKYFKYYYKNILVYCRDKFVASEQYLELYVPASLLDNPLYEGRILLSGTFDRLYKDKDGNYIMVDLKTSSMKITAPVNKPQQLQDYEGQKGSLLTEIRIIDKDIKKFTNAELKIKEHENELADQQVRFYHARTQSKPTKAIENKITKVTKLLQDWNEHLVTLTDGNAKLEVLNQKLSELNELIKPLLTDYLKLVDEAVLLKAKEKYNLQLAQYALMYMIIHGIKIKKVRVELLITRNEEPEKQIFEWELDDITLDKASYSLETVIKTIEAYFDGVPSRLLFKENTSSLYYGSETNEFIESLYTAS